MDNTKLKHLIESNITSSTIQLYQSRYNDFYAHGSSILIKIKNTYWLLSASHVLFQNSKEYELYVQYSENKFTSIAGFVIATNQDNPYGHDFGCVKLEQDFVIKILKAKTALCLDKIHTIQKQFEKQTLIMSGFPENYLLKTDNKIIQGGLFFVCTTSNRKAYQYYKINANSNIIVSLHGKLTDIETKIKTKKTELYGMSGGGLWKVWENGNELLYGLVGILTEYRKGKYEIVIANKIEIILNLIYPLSN